LQSSDYKRINNNSLELPYYQGDFNGNKIAFLASLDGEIFEHIFMFLLIN